MFKNFMRLLFGLTVISALLMPGPGTTLMAADWSAALNFTATGSNFTLNLGGNTAGTDGYDTGLDLPTAPPGMTYYVYFQLNTFPTYLRTDIRRWVAPYTQELSWKVMVINATNLTTTMTWNSTQLPPEGQFMLEGATTTPVNMRQQTTVTFSGNKELTIKYSSTAAVLLTQPNGGEIWVVGTTHSILWTSTNFIEPVKLEYSIDGGVTWARPPIRTSTPNDGSFSWTIPNYPSSQCKIQISDAIDGVPSDVSDAVFTIVRPTITVTAPNGGETLLAGNTFNITWTSSYFTGNVKIDYSIDNGVAWLAVTPTTGVANTGTYAWTVPATSSKNCKVRVADAVDADPKDESNAVFEIVAPIPMLKPVVSTPQNIGTEFWVEIKIDRLPVTDLFGLNFDLNFTNTQYVDVPTPTTSSIVPGEFLGADVIILGVVDENAGKVSVGVTRKTGVSGVNGQGVVAKVKFYANLNTPDGTTLNFTLSQIQAINHVGNSITLAPETASVVLRRGSSPVTVWPGDTNNDGVVSVADVLPLGLYYNATGPVREGATTNWIGQPCLPWTPAPATYADASGDGVVTVAEVPVIGLNYGKTHPVANLAANARLPLQATESNPLLIQPVIQMGNADTVFVELALQNVNNLLGLAFELNYSQPQLIELLDVVPARDYWGSECIHLTQAEAKQGRVNVGITRPVAQAGLNRAGFMCQIKFRIKSGTPLGTQFDFTVSQINALDATGQALSCKSEAGQFRTAVAGSGLELTTLPTYFELAQNYPNPFNPATRIQFQMPETSPISIKIYDVLGNEITTLVEQTLPAGTHTVQWDRTDRWGRLVPAGVYFYQFKTAHFQETRKMILLP
ncbi:T9SS type A sorting domain-containing protein [candidate division KSB1 bacterium]|nr:T9SS type A sorting domain-containing protein [candidate division KSB1 bacterium]